MKAYIFLAEGFEEIEAITPVDILRRANIDTVTVSTSTDKMVKGAHGITVEADKLFSEIKFSSEDYLILPGGMPGTTNLMTHEGLNNLIKSHYNAGSRVAAICAAPSLLGKLGVLNGREAIVYPGYEKNLIGAKISEKTIVESDNVLTAKGLGVAIDFSLKIVEIIKDKAVANSIATSICYQK